MTDLDPQIVSIQNDFLEQTRRQKRWIILETAEGWEVHFHTIDGVAPPSSYPTKRLAAARVLQLLGIGPVAPQDHPEDVCVGYVAKEPSHD